MPATKNGNDVLYMKAYERPQMRQPQVELKVQPLNLLFGGSLVVSKTKTEKKKSHQRISKRLADDNGNSTEEKVIVIEAPTSDSGADVPPPPEPKVIKKSTNGNGNGKAKSLKKTKDDGDLVHCLKKNSASICLRDAKNFKKPIMAICLKKSGLERKNKGKAKDKTEDTEAGYEAETSDSDYQPALPKKATKNAAKPKETPKAAGKPKGKKAETGDTSDTDATSAKETTDGSAQARDETSANKKSEPESSAPAQSDAASASAATQSEGVQTTEGAASTAQDKAEGTQTKGDSTADWTQSEDALILSMKGGGESWAVIGNAIGHSKKSVQKRWKELTSMKPQDNGKDREKKKANEKDDTAATSAGETTTNAATTTDNEDTSGRSNVAPVSDNDADNEASSTPEPAEKKGSKKSKRGKQAKPANTNGEGNDKSAPAKDKPRPNLNNKGRGVVVIPSKSSSPSSSADGAAEHAAQQDHIYTTLYPPRYPPSLGLAPDQFWSERDIRVLGVLDSKHRVDRWLELQAAFYNATGRMVPAEILRAKVEEGEKKKKNGT